MGGLIASTLVWFAIVVVGRWWCVTHLGDPSPAALKEIVFAATVIATIVGMLWP